MLGLLRVLSAGVRKSKAVARVVSAGMVQTNKIARVGWLGIVAGLIVVSPITPVSAATVGVGVGHSCAVVNGGVQCWGWNGYAQLGVSGSDSATPVTPIAAGGGVTAVAAGSNNTCAVVNGGVQCWGLTGQQAPGSPTAVTVLSSGSGVTSVATGGHTCVVVNEGVKCWGYNGNGRLGDGTTTDSWTSPVTAIAAGSGVTAVATGGSHTCAVVSGGVKCWGRNGDGQLGNGSTTDSASPVTIIASGSGVSGVAAGSFHTCAAVNGGVRCWGKNWEGELGNGSTTSSTTPVTAIAAGSGVTGVAAGYYHTCAVVNGGAQCWGSNDSGQLGNGGTIASTIPVTAIGAGSGVTEVATGPGSLHTCAALNGAVKCWGNNINGQLGGGSSTYSATAITAIASGVATTTVATTTTTQAATTTTAAITTTTGASTTTTVSTTTTTLSTTGGYGSVNLAKDKTVTALTNTQQGAPQNVTDGDITTLWYSYQGGSLNSNAFTVDLGASYAIGRIDLWPLQVFSFILSTSADGTTWTERYRTPWSQANVAAPISVAADGAYSARFVKFEGSADWNQYVGMIDLAVFEWLSSAPPPPAGSYGTSNLALNKTAADVAPITSVSTNPPGAALDGSSGTSWVANYTSVEDKWQKPNTTGLMKIDLGAEYKIGRITVRADRVHSYVVAMSTTDSNIAAYPSGAAWVFKSYPEMFGTATTSNEAHSFDLKGSVTARYIWVESHVWESPTVIEPSIAEIEVYEWVTGAAAASLNFVAGWNLLGNSNNGALDVAGAFGDSGKVTTVWKWIANGAKWAFYAPSLVGQALTDYANGKGYDVLTTINGGEGFWVNAKVPFTASLPSGTAISSPAFKTMGSGWNLIAVGDSPTPSAFNLALSPTQPAAGDIPTNLTTLWAWDATLAAWYFYAPSLDKSGSLANYITSKGYLNFGSRVLDPITGFWVNKP